MTFKLPPELDIPPKTKKEKLAWALKRVKEQCEFLARNRVLKKGMFPEEER